MGASWLTTRTGSPTPRRLTEGPSRWSITSRARHAARIQRRAERPPSSWARTAAASSNHAATRPSAPRAKAARSASRAQREHEVRVDGGDVGRGGEGEAGVGAHVGELVAGGEGHHEGRVVEGVVVEREARGTTMLGPIGGGGAVVGPRRRHESQVHRAGRCARGGEGASLWQAAEGRNAGERAHREGSPRRDSSWCTRADGTRSRQSGCAAGGATKRGAGEGGDGMITAWRLAELQCVRGPVELALAPLTCITGANSSGKSSVLQSMLMLAQTTRYSPSWVPLALNGPMVNLGTLDEEVNPRCRGGRCASGGL